MKKLILLLAWASLIAACTKDKHPSPDYGVYGLMDGTMVNDGYGSVSLPLSVSYSNGTANLHELISLSVSGLPEHMYMDSTWVSSAYPPFTTTLFLHGDRSALVYPGTYLITLDATSANMGSKALHFSVVVPYPPSCTGNLLGKYDHCYSYCNDVSYTDSVYADPVVMNKIWFSNFNNTSTPAYALYDCYEKMLSIPVQEINGTVFSGGNICLYDHRLNFPINYGLNKCVIDMY